MTGVGVLMLGDVSGEEGLRALERLLPGLIKEYGASFVVVNGENAADGFGLTEPLLERILAAGADAVTTGNHVWEKREFWPVLDKEPRVLRPANYPSGAAGHGTVTLTKGGLSCLVVNLQGREYMMPIDCPFRCFDAILPLSKESGPGAAAAPAGPPPIVLVDFHAESTREKEALALYLDGRASVVAGTHTHVQTADERLLPGGEAAITDLGICGALDSVIGMDSRICVERVRTQVTYRMVCAQGPASVQGIACEIDPQTARALRVERFSRA